MKFNQKKIKNVSERKAAGIYKIIYSIYSSQHCGCGQNLNYAKVMDSSCNLGCSGNLYNNFEYCGGISYISVYNISISMLIFVLIINTLGF